MAVNKPAIWGVILVFLLVGASVGVMRFISDREANSGYIPIGTVYAVRDVHIGYEGGHSIIMVEYYYNNHIRTVDNKMHWEERINQITVERATETNATLEWCSKNRQTHKRWLNCSYYPQNKYILYLPDNVDCSGVKSYTYRSDQEDYESWVN